MDSEENYLYYSNEKLLGLITRSKDKDEAIREYLRTVKYAPIKDFTEGLEWFNVSEPLSFSKHLKGKIVVLDFFTYCCINCMHVIPDLREIESRFSVEDGVVVIGVHSAKFENEKLSSNILSAVQRYNISHPVVNDHNSEMWQNCDVHCWPTLLLLGPNANPIVMLTGEGHKDDLVDYIKVTLDFYKEKNLISNHKLPFKSAFHFLPELKGPLLFPGKIASFSDENEGQLLAISDTGNNRILVTDSNGNILKVVGGKKLGFKDGTLANAEFNNPQGLVFQNKNILFVADTENHVIRKIDLEQGTVETVAGTGQQGHDRMGGKLGPEQVISSPWDVCIYRTPDMDLTFHPDGKPPIREVLLIAMAGTHQIWALFLDDTVWWKCKKYSKGTCINIAGSGREENRNNSYPNSAAFAQPSGLALCEKSKELYIADSESSSVRRLSLVDGKVTPVVGGERNPNNLFAFGDQDGVLAEAKLQHALGLTMSPDESILYVADTYNHKLKKVDVSENKLTTVQFSSTLDNEGQLAEFREPGGLCITADGKKIYMADTNNHQIKVLILGRNHNVTSIQKLDLTDDGKSGAPSATSNTILPISKPIKLSSKGGKVLLKFDLQFVKGLKLTPEAPQRWIADLPGPTYSCVPKNGSDVKLMDLVLSAPPQKNNAYQHVDVNFSLVMCTYETCFPKVFTIRVPLEFSESGDLNVEKEINVILDVSTVKVE
ncbi:NHL repeat-containing protein 2 [Euwallacea fornicatus]|uniref:NHL repeat-containing protein 2 n=1 Tax=Euwallacea fornicatus TaxID=995702 RepID=UPI00338EF400